MHGGHEKRKRSKEQFVSNFCFPFFSKTRKWMKWVTKKPISKLNATLQTTWQNLYFVSHEFYFDLTLRSLDIFIHISCNQHGNFMLQFDIVHVSGEKIISINRFSYWIDFGKFQIHLFTLSFIILTEAVSPSVIVNVLSLPKSTSLNSTSAGCPTWNLQMACSNVE